MSASNGRIFQVRCGSREPNWQGLFKMCNDETGLVAYAKYLGDAIDSETGEEFWIFENREGWSIKGAGAFNGQNVNADMDEDGNYRISKGHPF